jgi:tRNA nucleotidyltransferase/poly(A) polymerase
MGIESKDIDLIVPQKCLTYFHKNIKARFFLHQHKRGFVMKEKTQPLTRGKCIGQNLIQLEMFYQESDDDGQEKLVSFDLDLRPLAADESLQDDPKSRDFTINSAYYDPVKDEVFDIHTVTSRNTSLSKISTTK